MPESARAGRHAAGAKSNAAAKQTVRDTVVEYVVMQTRVMRGKPEDWKLWGFTKATTPEILQEDEDYWARTLQAQTSS